MKKVNEGQTQVYLNSMVTPQYGVNTNAPYLNTPPPQLMSLTNEFFKSGKSPAQVIAILVGMGTPQQLAQSAVNVYMMNNPRGITISDRNPNPPGYPNPAGRIKNLNTLGAITEKNNKTMQFTLNDLYERVQESLSDLNKITSDESRVSYSANNAKTVLENALAAFPDLSISTDVLKDMTDEEINKLKEGTKSKFDIIDTKINPTLKFNIATRLFRECATYDWIDPVSDLRSYIKEMYSYNVWSFKVNEAVSVLSTRNNPLDTRLSEDFKGLLKESADSIEDNIISLSKKNPWSREAASLANQINESRKGANQGKVSVERIFSPVLVEGNSFYFHLNGQTYRMSGSKITESKVADSRFNRIIEAMGMFRKSDDTLTMYGQNEKSLEINLSEGTIKLGETNLSEAGVASVKEALMSTRFFSHRDLWMIEKVCSLIEHIDMIAEMDNFLGLSSQEFLNVFLTMISVDEGIWVNKVNSSMRINEMKFFTTATDALNEAKSFIGYDATSYLSERLIKEGNEMAKVQERRDVLNKELTFLEEKKSTVKSAINKIGSSEELAEALSLINSEISKKEKELQSTYISEKKSKADYLNDGYIEATLKNSVQSLKKGQEVLINAEEFASLGSDDLIDVINAKTTKSYLVPKGDINVSF